MPRRGEEKTASVPRELKGHAVAPGIAIAPVVHFRSGLDFIPTRTITRSGVPEEEQRFAEAVRRAVAEVSRLRDEIAARLSAADAAIYEAQVAILKDPGLHREVIDLVRKERVNAEVALQRVVARYEQVFETIGEASIRDRAADVRDVGRHLMAALVAKERKEMFSGAREHIYAAEEFLPGDVLLVDRRWLKGIVTASGGKYSHGAILARSFGIPCVVGIEGLMQKVASSTQAVLDGERGVLVVEPDQEQITRYRERMDEIRAIEERLMEVRAIPCRMRDGVEVSLSANVDGIRDLEGLSEMGFSGVGLFRTEFVFMERREFPSEEEQERIYREALTSAGGLPVVFRTLDIGGDKPLSYFRMMPERNPVLGWRGVRLSFAWPDILYAQVRAIMRASEAGPARVMLPMVCTPEEAARGREVFEEVKVDLVKSGVAFHRDMPFGVMIEVPSAVTMLPEILGYVDFVSVGTNDLIQYLLAVDRDNSRVASLYDPYHPAVFRVLRDVAADCEAAGKPFSVCGEVAGDHAMTPVLVGLGYRELSMAQVFISRVKLMVTESDMQTCRRLADAALSASTARENRALLREYARQTFKRRLGIEKA